MKREINLNKPSSIVIAVLIILFAVILFCIIWFAVRDFEKQTTPQEEGFNESNYCEVQTINGTAVCLPEGVCEFQENSEGRKICLARR